MNPVAVESVVLRRLDTPVGPMTAGVIDAGLCLLEFADGGRAQTQRGRLCRMLGTHIRWGGHENLDRVAAELAEWFAGRLRRFTVPLVVPGTPFQQRVWDGLRRIPYGTTCSYAELATAVGNPMAARAVGAANGRNRIAIVIPCHRVVAADGTLGGYGGGLDRKAALLAVEGVTP